MGIDKKTYDILIIEDNPGDFALVEDFLFEQIEAPAITHAESYNAAQNILAGQKFDVILLDLSLPDKTGEELIRDLVDIAGNIPVIVLTGYTDYHFGIKSVSLGISDYILKEELTSISLYKSIIYSLERKKSVSELEESEKKYSELFHLSPLPMWVFDVTNLHFLDVNVATTKHYGYTREEFLSMTLKDIRPKSEHGKLDEAIANPDVHENVSLKGIYTHRKKNGDLIQVDLQSNSIPYKGKIARVILANDVTERVKYINAIEEQNQKLMEISWMQSHVIRAPLARIMGLVPLIQRLEVYDEENEKMLDYLLTSANELDAVIRSITDKTVIGSGKVFKR